MTIVQPSVVLGFHPSPQVARNNTYTKVKSHKEHRDDENEPYICCSALLVVLLYVIRSATTLVRLTDSFQNKQKYLYRWN